jgi:GPH family glycoside/pentoside/hexuronide:cation symporter
VLLFSLPPFESQWARFAYALAMILAVRVALSAFILPYASISAEVTTDYAERSVILTYRNFFNISGQLAAIYLGFGLFFDGENILKRDAYVWFGWAGAAVILLGALVSGISSLRLRNRLYDIAPNSTRSFKGLLREMIDVFKNRSFLLLFLCILIFWVAQAVFLQLGVHTAKYFWGLTTAMIADIQYLTFFGLFCGIFASGLVISRFEKRDISIVGLVIVCLAQLIPTVLAVTGIVPKTEANLYWLLGGIGYLGGIATTCVAVSFGSMMADSADEHEHIFGVRREALYFAGLTFSWKAALAIGGLVAGVALDLIQFPSDIAERPDQFIAPGTLNALALIYGPGAAVISAISAYVLVTYRLGKKELAQIQADLVTRRSNG